MNTFGNLYRVTTFGESHGPAIGGVIDGMPSGIKISLEQVQHELDRRRPGQNALMTERKEPDKVEILSGLHPSGLTLGTPIGFLIRNTNQRSSDYDCFQNDFRPNHADLTYTQKYGLRDHRGGGRSSARATASVVVAGAFARQVLQLHGITIKAQVTQVGPLKLSEGATEKDFNDYIARLKTEGDTVGGIIEGQITGCPIGLGEPLFLKLQAMLASAMMSINAVKGFDYGSGFMDVDKTGKQLRDQWTNPEDPTSASAGELTQTNHSGGIQGGISNGMPINFRVAFKPIPTLHLDPTKPRGRHDTCVLPRAVPIVEAMAASTILDSMLLAGKL